nr:CKLF-like MARVEL transmembrane domain-containing protein 2 [Aotus nancymaae]
MPTLKPAPTARRGPPEASPAPSQMHVSVESLPPSSLPSSHAVTHSGLNVTIKSGLLLLSRTPASCRCLVKVALYFSARGAAPAELRAVTRCSQPPDLAAELQLPDLRPPGNARLGPRGQLRAEVGRQVGNGGLAYSETAEERKNRPAVRSQGHRVSHAPKAAKGDKPAPEPAPPPAKDKPGEDEKDDEAAAPKKSKSVQPKHEVSTRKGCRRYRWELKDSNKEFWLLGHAEVKILSVVCLIVAMMLFSSLTVHPISMLIITMEISIFSFFILLYSFAINRYIPFILWPISVTPGVMQEEASLLLASSEEFGNAFSVAGEKARRGSGDGRGEEVDRLQASRNCSPFKGTKATCETATTDKRENRRGTGHLGNGKQESRGPFVFQILMSLAAFFAFIDVRLQRNHVRGKRVKKHMLVPPPGKEKGPQQGKEPEPAKPPEAAKPPEPAKGKK